MLTPLTAPRCFPAVPGQLSPGPGLRRTCLAGHLDAYLGAITGKQPQNGHLWVSFRQTENPMVVPEGAGRQVAASVRHRSGTEAKGLQVYSTERSVTFNN